MSKYYVVRKYIVCPGLHNWPNADVIESDDINITIDSNEGLSRYCGDETVCYCVYTRKDLADKHAKRVNLQHDYDLAKWRCRVYQEPIPASLINALEEVEQ